MKFRKTTAWALAIVAIALLVLPVFAQETTTGTLEGRVRDENGAPVPGATVSASGPQGTKAVRSGSDGKFSIPFLKPGMYEVKVDMPGFSSIILKDVEIQINRRTSIPIQLSSGKVETITVTAEAPLIDQKQTSIGSSIKVGDFVNYVPLGRNFANTFQTVPGVVSGGGTGAGNFSIAGASGLENRYIIDGVDITNTGYGGIGSYNIVYGSLGSGVTTAFLDEVQVKTGGFEAEYSSTGGVINTIVKSGTNEFTGGVGFYFTPRSIQAEEKFASLSIGAINQKDVQQEDAEVWFGGPIVKDKLFYFVAYNPVKTKSRFEIEGAKFDPAFVTGNFTTFPAAELGPQTQERTSDNWATKLSWYITPNHRVELSGFGDPSKGERGFQRTSGLRYLDFADGGGQSANMKFGGNNAALRYNAVFTPNFFGEFQVGYHKAKFRETAVKNEPRVRERRQSLCFLFSFLCPPGVSASTAAEWFVGGPGFLSNADDKSKNYSAKLTNVIPAANLEIKYGIDYADIDYTDDQAYSGEPIPFAIPVDLDNNGTYDPGELRTIQSTSGALADLRSLDPALLASNYRVVRARFYPTPPPTNTTDLSWFVQANWNPHPRVTIKPGVRVTQEEVKGSGEFSLPWSTNPATGRRIPGSTTYSPETYKFDTEVAPRLGVAWDVNGDGRTKAYLNVGRYFQRILNDLAVRAFSNEVGLSIYRFQNGPFDDASLSTPLSNPRVLVNPNDTIRFQGLTPSDIQKGTKLPYVDEAVLGYAYQIRPNLAVEARVVYRKQGRALEDVQFAATEQIQNYYYGVNYGYPYDPFGGSPSNPVSSTFPAAPFGNYVLANPGDNTPKKSGNTPFPFTKPEHTYKALELIVTKRLSDNWLMTANYRYSRLRGNYEGLFRNDNGQSDPNITSLFDFPNSPLMRGQFAEGPLNNDRPHVLNLYGAYQWDFGLALGASFNWRSGIPRQPYLAHPVYINSGEIPGRQPIYFWWTDDGSGNTIGAKGTAAQFFNDPNALLAFPLLFDYTDCKRGCLGRTSDEATVDVHIGYDLPIKDTTLSFAADVFNIFDSREPTGFDDNVESTAGVSDPDFLRELTFQSARSYRFQVRWQF